VHTGSTAFIIENQALKAEIARLRTALEMIAKRRQCVDNLMSNHDIAIAALDQK